MTAIDIFLNRFPNGCNQKIYHFTHLSNAINIIKSASIKSRNLLREKFDDNAGTNVNRVNIVHDYARFYFRPKTPTQFYNESLGHDTDSSYYQKSVDNGLPKCPFPVFFIIDLHEVLTKYLDYSFYSDGNMQSDSTELFSVLTNPERINGIDIDSNESDKHNAKQQEFLIKNELKLSNLETLKIVCFNYEQYKLLHTAVGISPLKDKISHSSDNQLFYRRNKQLDLCIDSSSIRIGTTNYRGDYEFVVESTDHINIELLEGSSLRYEGGKIISNKFINVPLNLPVKIYIVTKYPYLRKWCLYDNTELIYGR